MRPSRRAVPAALALSSTARQPESGATNPTVGAGFDGSQNSEAATPLPTAPIAGRESTARLRAALSYVSTLLEKPDGQAPPLTSLRERGDRRKADDRKKAKHG